MTTAKYPLGRRRLLALGGLAAAGAVTAGCGSNTGRDSGGGDSNGQTIRQWYHQYGEEGTQQAAIRYAEEYEEAEVEVQWIPGEYEEKLASGLLSNDGPDVFEGHINRQMVTAGQIVPLDDLFEGVLDDYGEVDINMNTVDGQLYGIKMINDPQLLYYRRSMLEDAGIDPPQTMAELREAAVALTNGDVKGLFLGNDGGVGTARALSLMAASGQPLLTEDNQVGFDSQQTIDTILEYRALQEGNTLLLGAPTDWWDPSAFIQGLCAITWNGLWAMPAILEELGDDFGVLPMPPPTGGQPSVYNGGWTTFVSAKARDVDVAKAFAKWLWIDSTDLQLDWCLSYGFHIPPRMSLAAEATPLQTGEAAEAVRIADEFGFGDNPNWTPAMQTAYEDFLTKTVRDGADPEGELATLVGKVQTELEALFG
jgi:multiple sugar transport system substrate-binding protein